MRFLKAQAGKGDSVIYKDGQGRCRIRSGGGRAWRNNNPGGIRTGNFARRNGAIGGAGGQAVFPDVAAGRRALLALLKSRACKELSLSRALQRHIPALGDDAESNLSLIEKRSGLKPDRPMKSLSSEEVKSLSLAIEKTIDFKTGQEKAKEAGPESVQAQPPTARARTSPRIKNNSPKDGESFFTEDSGVNEILLKPISAWTEEEARDVMRERMVLPIHDPRRSQMWEQELAWFSDVYGDGETKLDEFGRMMEPQPQRTIPDKPTPLAMPNGRPLQDGLEQIKQALKNGGQEQSPGGAVMDLQRGLNVLLCVAQEFKAEAEAKEPGSTRARPLPLPLREDGAAGAKTRAGIRKLLAWSGPEKALEGLALGRYHRMVADAGAGIDGKKLAKVTESVFGPLFRAEDMPAGPNDSKPEFEALQWTLNDLGPKALGRADWQDLEEDGRIGPGTCDAFIRVARAAGPDHFLKALGKNLGFY